MFIIPYLTSLNELLLLYSVELITLVYLWYKYKKSSFYVLIILLFYTAIFAFLGKNIQDGYKIIILLITLWISNQRKVFATFKKGDALITTFFVLFSLSYATSAFQNGDNWTIILSQFSRYLIAFCLWFLVRKELYDPRREIEKFKSLSYDLLLAQIVISIGKLIFFGGRQIEGIVGSLSNTGGAPGTTIPILGFILIWFLKRGVFEKKDWLFVAGLMMVGFLAGKRAVWFMMPVVIASFMLYVPRLKLNKSLWYAIIMAPLAFYFGVRLTPNMNAENKVWGSFDIAYALDFADTYQFGDDSKKTSKVAQGRGGATLSLWSKWNSKEEFTEKDWLGSGLSNMFAVDYSEFSKLNSDINMKGSATGVYQTYITTGYIGIFSTVLLLFSMLWRIKMKRIRWVLMAIVAWDYFLYSGTIFRTPALMFLVVFFIHYSNYLFQLRTNAQPISDSQQRKNYLRLG